jgi:hypothetical protein
LDEKRWGDGAGEERFKGEKMMRGRVRGREARDGITDKWKRRVKDQEDRWVEIEDK